MHKLAIAAAVSSLVLAGSSAFIYHGYLNYITDRFPYLDRKIARRALNRMFYKSLTGKYEDLAGKSDEEMETLYLHEVQCLLDL